MSLKIKIALLQLLYLFTACSHETSQEKLRQILLNADETYQLAAMAALPIMENKVEGITLTEEQKNILKRVSEVLASELLSEKNKVINNQPLSSLVVSSIETGVKGYVECLENIKNKNSIPQSCLNIGK